MAAMGEAEEADVIVQAAADGTKLTDGGTLSAGSYYLEDDVKLTTDITIASGTTVTIDLCGHTLTGTGSGSVITVNGTLTLTDSGTGGTVTGGSATNGGGVYVSSTGSFTMSGGTISGNDANVGGGVYVASGVSFRISSTARTPPAAAAAGGGCYGR
ncbi:MAG: hypothetical protein LUG44_04875, partial [Clostridiales bacterium]|nr:hypothetical protein [Clostridiales bacterium]